MKIQHASRIFALALPLVASLAVSATAQPRTYGTYDNNGGRFDSRDDARRGTVDRVYSNREFDLRTYNGSIIRVKTDSYTNLRRGDSVTLRGDLRGNTFYANIVNRRDDDFPGNQGRERYVDFRGEVVEIQGFNQLRVRDSQGRIYLVRTVGGISRRISRGDRVSVRGRFDGSFVRADDNDVVLLRNDNYYDNRDNTARRVDFVGIIARFNGRSVTVRSDNGLIYTIQAPYGSLDDLRQGDRVHIEGMTRANGYNVINASRVTRLR